ncbi:MAG: hypothetical protein HZA34_01450 [Candidatus Pacebacteria bacterium]|nr:hypothetical protein [Candidatus Paceibacterota bacterium]
MTRFFLFFILFFFSFFPQYVRAQSQEISSALLIINQVRGASCCDPGSVDALRLQVDSITQHHLKAAFAFRYDALQNEAMVSLIHQQLPSQEIEAAAFLEIIPSLAVDAHVRYEGPEDRWYKAKNAYLLGYSVKDRKALIDTYMTQYKKTFAVFPKITVAWMIDAWSLNYLSSQYGVEVHELTREQWGTDSYTLYGGPFQGPYLPSTRWPLVPSQGKDTLPLVMIRQTIPDPVLNYGDTTSSTTSQPNDYTLASRGFEYFVHLVDQSLVKGNGATVIGLENTMPSDVQREYIRQLAYIEKILKEHSDVWQPTITTYAKEVKHRLLAQPFIQFSEGETESNGVTHQAFWISTPSYRARLIRTGHQVKLTDLRIYSSALEDPYATMPVSTPNAYWITPFVLDGSRFRNTEQPAYLPTKLWDKIWWKMTKKTPVRTEKNAILNDLYQDTAALVFPMAQKNGKIKSVRDSNSIALSYETENNNEVNIFFTNDYFEFEGPELPKLSVLNGDLLEMMKDGSKILRERKTQRGVTYFPEIKNIHGGQDVTYRQAYAPEEQRNPISMQQSTIRLDTAYAMMGRNPIRIVIHLRDDQRRSTMAQQNPMIRCKKEICGQITIQQPETSKGEYFIDIDGKQAGSTAVDLIIDNETTHFPSIRFVTNCKKSPLSCLRDPRELWWNLYLVVQDRLHGRK